MVHLRGDVLFEMQASRIFCQTPNHIAIFCRLAGDKINKHRNSKDELTIFCRLIVQVRVMVEFFKTNFKTSYDSKLY